jgi:threonine/homoserine/homoserine lactone efflux protein
VGTVLAAIGQSAPIAFGMMLAAASVVILAVVLVTKRPLRVSYAFVAGWMLGLIVVGAAVLAVADGIELAGRPSRWAGVLKLALGIVLVVLAVRKWVARPRPGDEPSVPTWITAADTIGAGKALGLAFLLAVANPKNIVFLLAGAAVIADETPRVHEQAVALIVFVVVASVGVAAPAVVRLLLGARSDRILAVTDGWMTRNNAVITAAILLILGLILVGNGISAL